MIALLLASIVPAGQSFNCTPTAVWDGDGPIWCAEGPHIRLSGIAAREMDGSCIRVRKRHRPLLQGEDCRGANLERANSWPPTVHQKLASILKRGQPKLLKTLSIQKWGNLNAIEQRRKLVEP